MSPYLEFAIAPAFLLFLGGISIPLGYRTFGVLNGPFGPKSPPGPYSISREAGGGGGGLEMGSPQSLQLSGELWRFCLILAKLVNFFSGKSAVLTLLLLPLPFV